MGDGVRGSNIHITSIQPILIETCNQLIECQGTNNFTHAANLAAQNAFLFGNITQRIFINQAHFCLYGQGGDDGKVIIRTPWHLSIVSKLHTMLSTVLIFFILLALRNRFKIR